MLNKIDIDKFNYQGNNLAVYDAIQEAKDMVKDGYKVVCKIKSIARGEFLNVYVYDKSNWKYNLTKSLRL